jgi:hypothetical protein
MRNAGGAAAAATVSQLNQNIDKILKSQVITNKPRVLVSSSKRVDDAFHSAAVTLQETNVGVRVTKAHCKEVSELGSLLSRDGTGDLRWDHPAQVHWGHGRL